MNTVEYKGYSALVKCHNCTRVFDLTTDADAEEWYWGHDCEMAA